MTLNLEADDMTLHLWPALEHFCLACNNLPLFLLENIHQLRAGEPNIVVSLWSVGVSTCPCDAVCAPGVTTLLERFYTIKPCPLSMCVFMCHDVTWQRTTRSRRGAPHITHMPSAQGTATHKGSHAAGTHALHGESIQLPPTEGCMTSAAAAAQVVRGIWNALPCFWAAFARSSTA